MVASIDGHLPFVAACHCSLLLLLKIVIVFTWQINSLSLSLTVRLCCTRLKAFHNNDHWQVENLHKQNRMVEICGN